MINTDSKIAQNFMAQQGIKNDQNGKKNGEVKNEVKAEESSSVKSGFSVSSDVSAAVETIKAASSGLGHTLIGASAAKKLQLSDNASSGFDAAINGFKTTIQNSLSTIGGSANDASYSYEESRKALSSATNLSSLHNYDYLSEKINSLLA